jgi:hypothetical protein
VAAVTNVASPLRLNLGELCSFGVLGCHSAFLAVCLGIVLLLRGVYAVCDGLRFLTSPVPHRNSGVFGWQCLLIGGYGIICVVGGCVTIVGACIWWCVPLVWWRDIVCVSHVGVGFWFSFLSILP